MISGLTFLNPLLLIALLVLPLIYLILRVIPPAAKRVVLPTTRFLHDVEQKNPPTQKTPWWLLLLRLAVLAFLIVGLAGPYLKTTEPLTGGGPINLILDNGWAAGQTWDTQRDAALSFVQQAKRANRPVSLILTAPLAGEEQPQIFPAQSPDAVISQIKGLSPVSWPGVPALVASGIKKEETSIWVTTGLAEHGYGALLSALPDVKVVIPPKARLPLMLRPPLEEGQNLMGRAEAVMGAPSMRIQVTATDLRGHLVDQNSITLSGGQGYVDVPYIVEAKDASTTTRTQIAGRMGAGTVLLSDRNQLNTKIALISGTDAKDSYNLSDPAYYISRAVQPFAQFSTGVAADIIKTNPGIIIVADGSALPPRTLSDLDAWVKQGGILLRFANSALSEEADALIPVKLRRSERSLQGSMTWDNPLSIKSINPLSPLASQSLPADIRIRRQLLAEPSPDLAEKTWVTLSDDTPLVTAAPIGKGLIVLVHTTATPEWSDLPLSGFYVEIFKTLMTLAGHSDKQTGQKNQLQALRIYNGYGQLVQPPATLKPVSRSDFATLTPSSLYPPGLYGTEDESIALNLGDRLPPLEPIAAHVPAGNLIDGLSGQDVNYAPFFLYVCMIFFVVDCLVTLLLSGLWMKLRWGVAAIILFVAIIPAPAHANDAELAGEIHLAYIRTGDAALDAASEQGLAALSAQLNTRTAVQAGDVVALTPGQSELSFYPLIYWPISTAQPELSAEANRALQSYIDKGGLILIDTRDGIYRPTAPSQSAQIEQMRKLLSGLSFNPLAEAPEPHVIFKSFYLLNVYEDLALTGDIYVEDDTLDNGGAVSSIMLTGQDWGRVWASQEGGIPATRREQSIRFGINTVMYALTGNYKADQVHMNAILERLGQ